MSIAYERHSLGHDIPGALGGRGLLGSLALGLISSGGLSSGLGLLGSLGGGLRGLGGGSSGGLGGGGTLSRGLGDGLLLLLLGLHVLSGRRLALLVTAKEGTEDRGALPASRTLALVLLGVSGLLLGLLLSLSLGGGLSGSLSGGRDSGTLGGGGGLLSSLGGLGLVLLLLGLLLLLFLLLLLLLDGGGEGSEGGLVLLRLGDGGGELLGLSDPQLDLADPVVTLGSVAGLEGVLVALGGQDKLVGALGGGLSGLVLDGGLAG